MNIYMNNYFNPKVKLRNNINVSYRKRNSNITHSHTHSLTNYRVLTGDIVKTCYSYGNTILILMELFFKE